MIGIFDSGIGGLTFAKELNKQLPEYDFTYLGDQLRVPYGGRSEEAIQEFTEECINKLWDLDCKLIIIACNTASAEALRYLQMKYTDKKLLGILIPGVEKASEAPGSIGVVATKGTIATNAYPAEVEKRGQGQDVYQVATRLAVPFIEEGYGKKPECRKILRNYVRPLKNAGVKKLVLGCTHYPLIEEVFQKIMGPQIEIINPGKEAAIKLVDYLQRHPEIESQLTKQGTRTFYTTDCPDYFTKQGQMFYGGSFQAKKIAV